MMQKLKSLRHYYRRKIDNLSNRHEWVKNALTELPVGAKILDAGCGSQQFRSYCKHLSYYTQDIGTYERDDQPMLGASRSDGSETSKYNYGELDYVGNIWDVDEDSGVFDAILCTEVFEHIPYPNETVEEFARLLRDGGTLILTAPNSSLRHMDPYYYYNGFSDRWYEVILSKHGFEIEEIKQVGDYYSWLAMEIWRTMSTHGFFAKFILAPALLYYLNKNPTSVSKSTLCQGYHVRAQKVGK